YRPTMSPIRSFFALELAQEVLGNDEQKYDQEFCKGKQHRLAANLSLTPRNNLLSPYI
ncbi:hypothetical protein Ancab_001447, partial [Ancistrocladus abbreviatus]